MSNYSQTSDAGPSRLLAMYDRDEDGFPVADRLPNDGDARCENCSAPGEELLYLPEWRYTACPKCAAEAAAADRAELAARP